MQPRRDLFPEERQTESQVTKRGLRCGGGRERKGGKEGEVERGKRWNDDDDDEE